MKLSISLENSLKKDDLKGLATNLGEVGIDSLMENGLWKDIPVLSTLVEGVNTISSIRDALFVKKLITFLTKLSDIPLENRQKMIESLEKSKSSRINVGEKLIYLIERSEDHYSSEIIAVFFCAFLNSEINYDEFLKVCRIIDSMYIGDFLEFANGSDGIYLPNEYYLNTGLVDIYFDDVAVKDSDDPDVYGKYETSGGASCYITVIGDIVRKVLRDKKYT